MAFFSILCIVIAATCLFVGFYALRINSKSAENRLFLVICIWIAVINIAAVAAYDSRTGNDYVFWTHFVSFFTHTFFPINLHFYIYLFRREKLALPLVALIYGPPVLLMLAPLIDYRNYYDFKYVSGQWKWLPATHSPWLYLFLIMIIMYTVLTILYILKYTGRSKLNRERGLARQLIVNYAVAIGAGIVIVGIVPSFIPNIQNIGPSYSLFYVLGLFLAVFRYKFLSFRSLFVVEEIISHISDAVILVDPDYKIIHYNNKISDYFPQERRNLEQTTIFEITMENNDFRRGINRLCAGEISNFYCRLDYHGGAETISTDTYVSKITDNFNDISGFIIISKINKGRRLFKKTFGITEREFEVIDGILSGLSNELVGKKLAISERTVEAHCLHIYNKTGARDRLDLFRISAEYDIVPLQDPS